MEIGKFSELGPLLDQVPKKVQSQSSHTYRTYPAILVTGGYQGETDPYPAVLHASQDILEEVPWCRCRG